MERREAEGVERPILKRMREVKTEKMDFTGWASKPLIEFLISIGKDPNEELSQHMVVGIIDRYALESKLIHPEKNKWVVCDEKLRNLFKSNSINRHRIPDLLEAHFPHNYEYDSEDNKEDDGLSVKYAAIIPENIKLLHLKRTLVEDLLRNPESFACKVIGSYIRIKSDSHPSDYQLHPVIGVKTIRKYDENMDKEVFLLVPNRMDDISIDMLSDCKSSKDECEELSQRVAEGLLPRPTVREFEEKAQMLHEDITKHWISRELNLLQGRISHANEKGRRKDFTLHAYVEQREKLKKLSEQRRLVLEIPKVIPDEL